MDIIFPIAFSFYLIIGFVIYSRELQKYDKNIPYRRKKRNERIASRILLGLRSGMHYAHFIGTYDHKKYNTQVFTPKTLECHVGGIFSGLLWLFYLIISRYIYSFFGAAGLLILLIPIITNLMSLKPKT